jgi:uncharacterized protein
MRHGLDRADAGKFGQDIAGSHTSPRQGNPILVTRVPAAYLSTMRFAQDSFSTNSIRAYSDGEISVNEKIINRSVIITPDLIQLWEATHIDALTAEHCQLLDEFKPEVVIIGTGKILKFPPPSVTAGLQIQGIGVEIMAHDAACRTFNILLAEDRRVVVALLMNEPGL